MRAPDLQPLAAGIAALLLVASMAWWLLSMPELIDPGQPTWKGADIVQMKAAVPEIAPFEHFYVNHDNPFVPHHLRVAERDILNPNRPRVVQTPPRPVQIPPPKPPVIVAEPEKPKLVLPKLTRPPTNAPIVYGLLVNDGQELLIVRMPDGKESKNLKPGDKIADWTLVSIDSGNLATFLDPQGIEHRFVIGQGDLAVAQSGGATLVPGKDAAGDKTNGGRGMVPKVPGTGVPPVARPPGVDGPIPRPPPREERRRREQPPPEGQGKTPVPPPVPVPKK